MGNSQPYDERPGSAKVKANWTKTRGLVNREDWSMSIVRAAICVELAANLTIHILLKDEKTPDEVDKLLVSLTGLEKKLTLIVKKTKGTEHHASASSARKEVKVLKRTRNQIVHGGIFANESEALALISDAYTAVTTLVLMFEPEFALKAIVSSTHERTKNRKTRTDESNVSDSDSPSRY